MLAPDLQPDQRPSLWDRHVESYEAVFEPLTNALAREAIAALGLGSGMRCLDVAAGAGGAALMAARLGAAVVAIDGSAAMVRRIRERASAEGLPVEALAADAAGLDFADASFDAALSVLGIILFPNPLGALREMARVVAPGGRIALVTWTEPERYELVGRLMGAIAAVGRPLAPMSAPPAQLRFREKAEFLALFQDAGLPVERIVRLEAPLRAPSARWLADRLTFAPGLAGLVSSQSDRLGAVLDRFAQDLERDRGPGEVSLDAVASLGVARKLE